jgi:hypothetical protein
MACQSSPCGGCIHDNGHEAYRTLEQADDGPEREPDRQLYEAAV